MKLTHIKIKDFRSFSGEHEFELGTGVNYVVGPNNCGKSNLVRALAFALDPQSVYVPERDRPIRDTSAGNPPKTRITLTFAVGASQPEKTLIKRAEAYEKAVRSKAGKPINNPKTHTFAGSGVVQVVRTFGSEGVGVTTFGTKSVGTISLAANDKLHQDLESQFAKVVRFGVIHSGEDLESLLKGKFREILQLVINDHLGEEVAVAEEARRTYQRALQDELLRPLRDEIEKRVGGMFPEISVADLVPDIPTVDDTLSSVDVRLGDEQATTQLTEKGTGVRGAVLVSMLQYMADQSRRSMVLAVEEPEAFLHPAAQEAIRGHLEELASRGDVSLIVTTHSPYVISRTDDVVVTELRKRPDGWTERVTSVQGSDDRSRVLGSLYRDPGMADALENSMRIPPETEIVVVTEGFTDGHFIRQCLEATGQSQLIEGMHFIHAGNAKKVPEQALMIKGATSLPVVAMLDHDDEGDEAFARLAAFGWKQRSMVLSLKDFRCGCSGKHPKEIENLLPMEVQKKTIGEVGLDRAIDGQKRCGQGHSYEFSKAWKDWAVGNLPRYLGADAPGIVWLVEQIRTMATKQADKAAADARHRMTSTVER
ncbi:ATP-binding protein [Janibacter hoylei]|uniref:ATP-dependent nuclease n=1 Tax=Janibacter hoylei TaxID=364298 RepID=UPI002238896E|nr:ATP-binding protein [Janibacter hoylei]MCW4602960.1 ATP-binding protein [Janibacter hoylei]